MHAVKLIEWDRQETPSEAQLRDLMSAQGLQPYRWSNGPGDEYDAHEHGYHKVIYVVRGSIAFFLPQEGGTIKMQAGDRLELPAGVVHRATVGPDGVICLEGHIR